MEGEHCTAYMGIVNGNATMELLEAQANIWKYTFSFVTSMSLKCAVQLGIPDTIFNHGKAITLSDLVTALSIPQTKSTHLFRLMRILVHSDFFAVEKVLEDQEGYVLTPSSKLLLRNQETNLSNFILTVMDPTYVKSCDSMTAWFQGTESTPFEVAQGMDVWKYYGQHPNSSESFDAGMASDSEFVTNVVVKEYKAMFAGFGSLVDVGGGIGTTVKAISKAFPLLRCTVLDLPQVVHSMEGSKSIEFVGGDMFESIPCADIILLKWILHDWSDEECVKILKRCREAIPSSTTKDKGGKVIVIDIVIDGSKGKHESTGTQLCLDIFMMAATTGRERSEIEWERLFLDAGFRSYKITHGLGLRSIIEVFP